MGKTYKDHLNSDCSLKTAKGLERAKRAKKDFRCQNCSLQIQGHASGSQHRNHCPFCLHSRHVDNGVGNRTGSVCGGLMKPQQIRISGKGEIQILHVCLGCHKHSWNRISGDDNLEELLSLTKDEDDLFEAVKTGYLGKTFVGNP